MNSLRGVKVNAKNIEKTIDEIRQERSEARALQQARKVYHPMGCTLNFTPGWEVDISGGTAGLCQPVERDLFDCYLGCGWPAQVPDHVNNAPDWTDKCFFCRARLAKHRHRLPAARYF